MFFSLTNNPSRAIETSLDYLKVLNIIPQRPRSKPELHVQDSKHKARSLTRHRTAGAAATATAPSCSSVTFHQTELYCHLHRNIHFFRGMHRYVQCLAVGKLAAGDTMTQTTKKYFRQASVGKYRPGERNIGLN